MREISTAELVTLSSLERVLTSRSTLGGHVPVTVSPDVQDIVTRIAKIHGRDGEFTMKRV